MVERKEVLGTRDEVGNESLQSRKVKKVYKTKRDGGSLGSVVGRSRGPCSCYSCFT